MAVSFSDILTGTGIGLASVAIAISVEQYYTARFIDNRRHIISEMSKFKSDFRRQVANFETASAVASLRYPSEDIENNAKIQEYFSNLDIRDKAKVQTQNLMQFGRQLIGLKSEKLLESPAHFLRSVIILYIYLITFAYFAPVASSAIQASWKIFSRGRPPVNFMSPNFETVCKAWTNCIDFSIDSVSLFFLLTIFIRQAYFTASMVANFEKIDEEMTERFKSFRNNQESLKNHISFLEALSIQPSK